MKKNLFFLCLLIFAQLSFGQTIDGIIGAGEWDAATEMVVEKDIDMQNITGADDYSLYFKMLWTATHLYLLIDVTDDIVYLGNSADYRDDNLEIYFDMNNSKIQKWPRTKGWASRPWTQMDDNDMQLRIKPEETSFFGIESNVSGSYETVLNGIEIAQVSSATGYIFEMAFNLDSLAIDFPDFVAAEGTLIGFEIDASDNDGDPDFRDQVGWSSNSDLVYTDAVLWGTLQFEADGSVSQILDTEAPTVPTNLAGVADNANVVLTWDPSTDNSITDWYVIFQDDVRVDTVQAKEADNTATVKGLTDGTYSFAVAAFDPFGNESGISTSVDVDVVVVDVENTTYSFDIYPVPVTDVLNIRNIINIDRVELYDMIGQSLFKTDINSSGSVKIDVSAYKAGVYVLKLHTAGKVITRQIVLE